MTESGSATSSPVNQQVIYRSFLLRLRIVEEGKKRKQQFLIKDIHTEEEFYFANLYDMTRFLNDFLSAPQVDP